MMKSNLILFTRYPVPGKTKTRLIPALGEQGAADLHRAMTQHTVECVRLLMEEGVWIEVRYEGGDPLSMARWLGQDLSFLPQGEGDLGVRMERAFRESSDSGAGKTVIIGTDCPDLAAQDVQEAFNLLESNPVVLGPATDGGYYLIGIRAGAPEQLYKAVFSGIPWGSGDVLSSTVNALAVAGFDLGLLDEKTDVDEPGDLVHWERRIRIQNPESRIQEKNQVKIRFWTKAKTRTRSESDNTIPSTAVISVIIPVLNEEKRIGDLLSWLKECDVEVVVADGGSTDGTVKICHEAGIRLITSKTGRAAQMNAGAREASGQILLFLHADTRLPDLFEEMIREVIAAGRAAGAFSFGTDLEALPMRLIERAANMRARLLGIVFGDQGIFVRADLFREIGGFPDLAVMEDMELVRRLKKHGRFVNLPGRAISSSRRWRANGVWRTTLMNQAVMWFYMLGVSPEKLAGWYRKKLKV